MLKLDRIVVTVESFEVAEIQAERAARKQDKLRRQYESKGNATLFYMIAREFFVERLKGWTLDIDCSEQNKRDFYEEYTQKANDILAEAEKLITLEREKRLKNLLGGAGGT